MMDLRVETKTIQPLEARLNPFSAKRQYSVNGDIFHHDDVDDNKQ